MKSIQIPVQLIECRDVDCVKHHAEINELHNDIIWACLSAADDVFSVRKPCNAKVTPGWNDFVEDLFRTALFWHDIWTQNDRPSEGIMFELRKKTRKDYHQALKEVIRNSDKIKCDKMAKVLSENNQKLFWSEVRKFRNQVKSSPGNVDGFSGNDAIAGMFAEKFEELYNTVGYDESDTINFFYS